jgi:hypothetical protein
VSTWPVLAAIFERLHYGLARFRRSEAISPGRVITIAYLFGLPYGDEVTVAAGDDAGAVGWHAINSLDPAEFFEDHHHIIQEMAYSM